MHIGSYDDEPATVDAMHRFMEEQGYVLDITDKRLHHEIYLSDVRKVQPEKLKTVIRHPIRKERSMDYIRVTPIQIRIEEEQDSILTKKNIN